MFTSKRFILETYSLILVVLSSTMILDLKARRDFDGLFCALNWSGGCVGEVEYEMAAFGDLGVVDGKTVVGSAVPGERADVDGFG